MFMRKSKHREEVRNLHDNLQHKSKQIERAEARIMGLREDLEYYKTKIDELEANLADKEAKQTSMTLTFTDDIMHVTPTIRYTDAIVDKLIESKYLISTQRHDPFAVQLSIMLASEQAIQQILDSYAESFEDPDFKDDED